VGLCRVVTFTVPVMLVSGQAPTEAAGTIWLTPCPQLAGAVQGAESLREFGDVVDTVAVPSGRTDVGPNWTTLVSESPASNVMVDGPGMLEDRFTVTGADETEIVALTVTVQSGMPETEVATDKPVTVGGGGGVARVVTEVVATPDTFPELSTARSW
jgi:hypothetical protein